MPKKTRLKTVKRKKEEVDYDTTVKTYEKVFNIKISADKDMKLGEYLKRIGYPSLAKIIKKK